MYTHTHTHACICQYNIATHTHTQTELTPTRPVRVTHENDQQKANANTNVNVNVDADCSANSEQSIEQARQAAAAVWFSCCFEVKLVYSCCLLSRSVFFSFHFRACLETKFNLLCLVCKTNIHTSTCMYVNADVHMYLLHIVLIFGLPTFQFNWKLIKRDMLLQFAISLSLCAHTLVHTNSCTCIFALITRTVVTVLTAINCKLFTAFDGH